MWDTEKEKGTHMKIRKLEHFVLTVRDIEKTISFYVSVMGMKKEVFGQGRVALRYGDQKINLHELGNEFEPKAANPMPGSADLCFITKTPLNEAMSHVRSFGVEIIEGPVQRTGARGSILSFYFRDPDNNLIEVANEV
jgi:catechol 2,3-dioxygenase-like lactoylglutathione lyase family enzyme